MQLIRPFTAEDVKLAMFDINEDKAPGPDDYSSGFFKAAWSVVGPEITRAVLDFFAIGRLLKQVNSTILAPTPNVLDKMISPCQAAFIHGKSIGNNIMMAQELFTGYKQRRLPPRCALKIDICKAYDTVEWDFLLATLQLYGFPVTFRRWIEECVTTSSFLVGINGKPHGFFVGSRGLRQGDPLSPYMFVFVMEVLHLVYLQMIDQDGRFTFHWKCEASHIFQLGFADDVILFCRADAQSIRVFKEGLDRFGDWLGLRRNGQKSHLILSKSAQDIKEELLMILGFQEGQLPMRLRNVLRVGRGYLFRKRVQIIKSVLTSLSVYWASAFILPKCVIKEIEKRLRRFLWKGTGSSGYAKVAWTENVYLGTMALPWTFTQLLYLDCCRNQRRLGLEQAHTTQGLVKNVGGISYRDGRDFYLWRDPWHHLGPLIERFPRGPNITGLQEHILLHSVIREGQWHWPHSTDMECLEIVHTLPMIYGGSDQIIWRCSGGTPTTQALYKLLDPPGPKLYGVLYVFFGLTESGTPILNATRRWRGKHVINVVYRTLLGACVYHIWRERNLRRFENIERSPTIVASVIIEDVRLRILSTNLSNSVSTSALHRLWRIPWHVEGDAST
ncbi:uncharacterized protein LOC105162217 [Sesamum indicum]|uniref:Uncharacterized protein LOC105162217 n=1 Tax=Sesamum indicum TaxID=4182 RepID=A0A6I9T5W8_SESIN|nr:uncharacterized protein LOC105162217 [Sesamum indicum]